MRRYLIELSVLALYVLSVAFPYYLCYLTSGGCPGPAGDVFMLPFFFGPVAFIAMLVLSLRFVFSRDFLAGHDRPRIFTLLAICVVLYALAFFTDSVPVRLNLVFLLPFHGAVGPGSVHRHDHDGARSTRTTWQVSERSPSLDRAGRMLDPIPTRS